MTQYVSLNQKCTANFFIMQTHYPNSEKVAPTQNLRV